MNDAVAYDDIASRRDDANVARRDPHAFARFLNRHRGVRGQQLAHHARMRRSEMLNQDKSHLALGGKRREKRPKGFKAAGRGADANHGKVGRGRRDYTPLRSTPRLFWFKRASIWRTARNHKSLSPHDAEVPIVTPRRTGLQAGCLLYTSPSPRDRQKSRMPSSA